MRYITFALALAVFGGAAALTGCDREVSHQEKTKVKDDGTVEKKEETVTKKPDGTVQKEEKKEVSNPNK